MRTLFYNGDILTMESPRPAEAVLTDGRRIMAVGDLSAIAPAGGKRNADRRSAGRRVTPRIRRLRL